MVSLVGEKALGSGMRECQANIRPLGQTPGRLDCHSWQLHVGHIGAAEAVSAKGQDITGWTWQEKDAAWSYKWREAVAPTTDGKAPGPELGQLPRGE